MFHGSKKPYSAVTVQVDRLTSEQYEEDDLGGIFDLVEVVRIQESGPTEAARALRKKLKYGSLHIQIRALVLLDGLIQNAGARFQRAFADEPLLERLRQMPRDEMVDPQVRQKCQVLFVQWANAYQGTPGLERIANLYKELPKTQRPAAARQKVLQDVDLPDSDGEQHHAVAPASAGRSRASSSAQMPPSPLPHRPMTLTPTSSNFSAKLHKTKGRFTSTSSKSFNLAKEKENMTNCLARASIASTNLLNGLQLINRETERVSQNPEILNRFDTCKGLRRQILLYIQQVESDEWIGSLVNANDELVKALTAFEIMDRSIDDDSDSDAWETPAGAPSQHTHHVSADTAAQLAGLSLAEGASSKPRRAAPGGLTMSSKPNFPSAPPPLSHQEADDADDSDCPEKVSLRSALARSSTELDFEDRVVSWQRSASSGYTQEAEGSPSVSRADTESRTSMPVDAESESMPLTEANLMALQPDKRNDFIADQEPHSSSVKMLMKVGKVIVKPITIPCKAIMRFHWGTTFWGGKKR
ncbi:hypothetical protein LTR08_004630 [Meristemomyces frigidus]|nr:hypothetical protein LTR08_004630 [Meristemomyces frigidus]